MFDRDYFDNMQFITMKEKYPEIYALIGVPQPPKWHPEGDAYQHTMMVLEEALARYHGIGSVMWSAICHDFGKAYTQKHWPSHHGHAELGLTPTKKFLEREGIKKGLLRDEILFITKYHMHIHKTLEMRGKTYFKIYREAVATFGVKHAMEALLNLARLGVCDHYGRGGVDRSRPYFNSGIFYFAMRKVNYLFTSGKNENEIIKEIDQRLKELHAVHEEIKDCMYHDWRLKLFNITNTNTLGLDHLIEHVGM